MVTTETAISFFPATNQNGFFTQNDALSRIFTEAIRIITTRKGTHFEDPEFGTDLQQFLSTIIDSNTKHELRQDIVNALTLYLPEYSYFIQVNVMDEPYSDNVFRIELKIEDVASNLIVNTSDGTFTVV